MMTQIHILPERSMFTGREKQYNIFLLKKNKAYIRLICPKSLLHEIGSDIFSVKYYIPLSSS